ncbi:7-cyano-7-deazaguanine synthase QueC [Brackiella oedipodis]|uniref:7-cyano-7-deazaguanine synthase QueC n=1 Tax=Brackiella oedipodis TaxID=124225 RepID=UPI000685AFB9|nr:7-cyano-7-deazaguanine synthase QueC [Brackiella oedipodis]
MQNNSSPNPAPQKEKALVIFSGGQDSTTCLYWAKAQGYDVHTLSFDYGQRHAIELQAAKKVAAFAGIAEDKQGVCQITDVLLSTSPLTSEVEPEQFASPEDLPQSGVQNTFVPMRNQLFLTIAANRAYALNCRVLITGVSQADYGGYPDCRENFIKAFETTCNLGTFTGEPGTLGNLQVLTPLMHLSKAQEVLMSYELKDCFAALAWSHTAYDGQYPPVGHDHANVLRAKGFAQAGLPDPLVLRAHQEGLMPLPETDNYKDEVVAKVRQVLEQSRWLG